MYFNRKELDQMDSPDKYPEQFRVTLELAVSPKERPLQGQNIPWQGFTGKGLGPKILFTTKEEQEEVCRMYGQ